MAKVQSLKMFLLRKDVKYKLLCNKNKLIKYLAQYLLLEIN